MGVGGFLAVAAAGDTAAVVFFFFLGISKGFSLTPGFTAQS